MMAVVLEKPQARQTPGLGSEQRKIGAEEGWEGGSWLVSEACFRLALRLDFGPRGGIEIWRYGGGVAEEPCFLPKKGPRHPDHDQQTQSFSREKSLANLSASS